MTNKQDLIDYIYEFAWRYGRLYHVGDSDKILSQIDEVFQLPEEALEGFELVRVEKTDGERPGTQN